MWKLHLRVASIIEAGLKLKTSMHNSQHRQPEKLNGDRLYFYDVFYTNRKTRNIRVDYNALTLDPSDKSGLNYVFT